MREPETRDKQEVETPTSFLVSHLNKTYLPYSGSSAKAALNFLLMEKKKKDEELQSRRDFFKKAAKAALPIVGAMVLSHVPLLSKASEDEEMGCDWGCSGACKGGCGRSCLFYPKTIVVIA